VPWAADRLPVTGAAHTGRLPAAYGTRNQRITLNQPPPTSQFAARGRGY
jgi:hypothetical protein